MAIATHGHYTRQGGKINLNAFQNFRPLHSRSRQNPYLRQRSTAERY